MPRIKRWFPVSHDINSDPEVWAMRKQIGEKSLSIWLEFLSIADRNEGEVPGDYEQLVRSIAGRCQATTRSVSAVYQFAISRLWLDSHSTLRVSKWAKYHRTAEHKPAPSEPDLTRPDLTRPIEDKSLVDASADAPSLNGCLKQNAVKPDMTVQEFTDSWNEVFESILPGVVWPLSATRHQKAAKRLKEHPEMAFWEQVFRNIAASDFLTGKKTSWKCSFDFLITNDTNVLKIYEGSYSNGENFQSSGFSLVQGRR